MVDEQSICDEEARAASVRDEQAARRASRWARPTVRFVALTLGMLALVAVGSIARPYVRGWLEQLGWTGADALEPLPFSIRLVSTEDDQWQQAWVRPQYDAMLACTDLACIEAMFIDAPVPAGSHLAYVLHGCYNPDVPRPAYMPVLVEEKVWVGPGDVESAHPDVNEMMGGRPATSIVMAPAATVVFSDLTRAHVGRRAAVYIGDQLTMAPRIFEPIESGRLQVRLPQTLPCTPMDHASSRRISAAIERAAQQARLEAGSAR